MNNMQLVMEEDKLLIMRGPLCYRYLMNQHKWLLSYTDILYQVFDELTGDRKGVPPDCVPALTFQHLASHCALVGWDTTSHKEKDKISKLLRRMSNEGILLRGYGLFWLNPKYKFME